MILDKEVKMTWNSNNKKYYVDKGYIFTKMYDIFIVNINDLISGSPVKITVKCDVCEKIKILQYREYMKSVNNYGYYSCSQKCSNDKSKQTCLKNYGTEVSIQSEIGKNKFKITNLKKYGFEHPSQRPDIKLKKVNTCMEKLNVPYPTMSEEVKEKMYISNVVSKRWSSREERSDYHKYELLVNKYTLLIANQVFDKWDGFDHYTGEYIKNDLILNSNDKKYPTIDHKISIKHGFDNGILPSIISSIDNLCITTRSTNSSKNKRLEEDYISMLNLSSNAIRSLGMLAL